VDIHPFTVNVSDAALEDLRTRLDRARWPDEADGVGWSYGVPVSYLQWVAAYWRDSFDWREQERYINGFANFRTTIEGVDIHFIHERGKGPNALPLLITHGWPSSFYEMLALVLHLTDPGNHRGSEHDAFDVVVPAVPGYPFSERQTDPAFSYVNVADLWVKLMARLGYRRFGAHAYDIGASITSFILRGHPERVIGYHTTEPSIPSPYLGPGAPELTADEREYRAYQQAWEADEGGYMALQRTRPQSLGYGLNDSAIGLAAWIIEKWYAWTEPPDGDLESHFTLDQLLATVSLYWFSEAINPANRLYRKPPVIPEHFNYPGPIGPGDRISVPTGVALSTQRIERAPRSYVERLFTDIRQWRDLGRGGHFVALEEPALLADSLRAFFRPLREPE
jgi:pimeloyl-ACP methyl ester carboxylesterase